MDTRKLRQKILDLAIRGKLVPQDPNDEPASVLLERIKAEKEQLIKEGKIKRPKKTSSSDKSHYENIPFEIPEGWALVDFSELISLLSGRDLETANYNSNQEGIPYLIGASNIVDGKINITRWTTKPLVISKYGDILISCKGTIGEIVVNEIGEIHIARQFMAIQTLPMIYTEYIELFIRSIVNNIKSNARGVIPGISREDILHRKIALPPLDEQRRIVIEMKKWLDLITDIETEKLELKSHIKGTKSQILDLAISGKLVSQDPTDEPAIELLKRINPNFTSCDNSHYENLPFEIPQSWVWSTLGKIGKWQSGATPSRMRKDYYGGDIPWLKTGDLNDNYITDIPESITELALKETSVKLNPSGSILIAMYGATIGKIGILTMPATTNQACCACIEHDGIEQKYLFYYLLSHKEEFIRQGGGGAQPNISKEKIIETLIPIPPLKEQRRIVNTIETIFSHLDTITAEL